MAIVFPAGIDSFDIRSPEEVIRASHMNNIQEAIVAIELFVLSLEQSFNNHITQTVGSHAASTISVSSTPALTGGNYPINATQVQIALQQIKAAIEAVDQTHAKLADFQIHLNTDINTSHPGFILGSKIADGTITENKLAFDVTTQVELDTHEAEDINTAHPGLITGSKIADNTIPSSKLNFPIVLQQDLNDHIDNPTGAHKASAIELNPTIDGYNNVQSHLQHIDIIANDHINATTGVHGVDQSLNSGTLTVLENAVLGRLDSQRVENKTLISAFEGSKVLLFTGEANELEKEIFSPLAGSPGDLQFQIRNPACTNSTNIFPEGTTIDGYGDHIVTVDVVDSSLFNPGDNISIRKAPGYSSLTFGEVKSIPSPTQLELKFSSPTSITLNTLITNESIRNPVFSIDSNGIVNIYNLKVENAALDDIEFNDNVSILGNLVVSGSITVSGNTTFSQNLTINGALQVNSVNITNQLEIGGSLNIQGPTVLGSSLFVSQNTILNQDLLVNQNIIADGYLLVVGNGTVFGNFVANTLTASSGVINGINLTILKADLENHLPTALVLAEGFKHHSNYLAYDSPRHINVNLPASQLGVMEVANFIVDGYNTSIQYPDGYITVDEIGVIKAGDVVLLGDDIFGYESAVFPFNSSRTRTVIEINTNLGPNPLIILDDFTDIELLQVVNNAKMIKRVNYVSTINSLGDPANKDSLTDIIDALAIDIYNHSNIFKGLPSPAHVVDHILADSLSIGSIHFNPTTNSKGFISAHTVLEELGQELYDHLADFGLDGYYVHNADVIQFQADGYSSLTSNNVNDAINELEILFNGQVPNPIRLLDGYEISPAYSFIGETTTGMWRPGSNQLALTVAGNNKVSISNIDVTFSANLVSTADTIIATKTPATSGSPGTTGEIAWDNDYIYVCVATNTWKRSPIVSW